MLRAMKRRATASPVNAALRRSPRRAAAALLRPPSVGTLAGLGPAGEAWVDLPKLGHKNLPARSSVALIPEHVGREVLVTWVDGDRQPVITGVIRTPIDAAREAAATRFEAIVDAERIVLTGKREVVLRCGKASVTLSADGSVVVKGAKLLTSATGVHRIRGGAVQIN